MNNIEETLWSYIDGNCTADEQKTISALIAGDEVVRMKYQELLSLHKEFSAIELHEPAMAFTFNIMEAIRTENAQKPLKAAINRRIIIGIASFFILTIVVLVVYILVNIQWTAGNVSISIPAGLKLPDFKEYFTGPVLQVFLFFDTLLGLFLVDAYLRKRNLSKPA